MKNLNSFFALVCLFTIISSCSEDDKAPVPLFTVKGEEVSVSLEDDNIYLLSMSTIEHNTGVNYYVRYYLITDGTYIENSNPLDLENYENVTYFLKLILGSPATEFPAGDYKQATGWNEEDPGDHYSIISFEHERSNGSVIVDTNHSNYTPVHVSGGFNNDQSITVSYSGPASFRQYDSSIGNWVTTEETVEFYYAGTIKDIRN